MLVICVPAAAAAGVLPNWVPFQSGFWCFKPSGPDGTHNVLAGDALDALLPLEPRVLDQVLELLTVLDEGIELGAPGVGRGPMLRPGRCVARSSSRKELAHASRAASTRTLGATHPAVRLYDG